MSTGFYLASSMPTVPLISEGSANRDPSRRFFRTTYLSTPDSMPPVPPPTPQLAASTAAEDYGDVESRDRRVLGGAASPSATQLKRRAVDDKGSSGLAFVLVSLDLCAFVWLLASGELANQAHVVNRELEDNREEAVEPVVVLRLEDNSGSVHSQAIRPRGGETVVEMRTRTTMTVERWKTMTAPERQSESTSDDPEEDELSRARPKARETEGPRDSEDADAVRSTQDTGPTQLVGFCRSSW